MPSCRSVRQPSFLKSCVTGVGNIPLPAIADRLCPICEFGFHVFVHFTPSMAVGVGSSRSPYPASVSVGCLPFMSFLVRPCSSCLSTPVIGPVSLSCMCRQCPHVSYLIWLVRLPNFVPFLYPFFSALALIFSGGSSVCTVVGV